MTEHPGIVLAAADPAPTVRGWNENIPLLIGAPSDPHFALKDLAMDAASLPTNGTVSLAGGHTPVSLGEPITAARLAGLVFESNDTIPPDRVGGQRQGDRERASGSRADVTRRPGPVAHHHLSNL